MIDLDRSTTTSVLLAALHDPGNRTVWDHFTGRYRPIVTAFARRLGLDAENAAEVAQQTLTEFVRDYQAGKYDRNKGRLSSWIMGIARHRVIDLQRTMAKRREWRGESAFVDLADEDQLTHVWEDERRRAIFSRAWVELKENTKTSEKTLGVFNQVAMEGVPAKSVAGEFGVAVAEVYRIKNRITKQLRKIIAELTELYEEA